MVHVIVILNLPDGSGLPLSSTSVTVQSPGANPSAEHVPFEQSTVLVDCRGPFIIMWTLSAAKVVAATPIDNDTAAMDAKIMRFMFGLLIGSMDE
jgi:hypothetical protein